MSENLCTDQPISDIYLYIHVPFCLKKCPYCAFYSIDSDIDNWAEPYFEAVRRELELYDELLHLNNTKCRTIYFGGGNPSAVDSEYLDRIISVIDKKLSIDDNAEITVEGNPETLDREKLREYRRMGVNRLSIGVQSLIEKHRLVLGRDLPLNDVYRTIGAIQKEDFDSYNLDMIFNIPGQTVDDLTQEIDDLVGISPDHISWYGLIIEEGTGFYDKYKKRYEEPANDELYHAMYLRIAERLGCEGYNHYEISNYCKPGKGSPHNSAYWKWDNYLGLGASASSYIRKRRFKNDMSVNSYIAEINGKGLSYSNPEIRDDDELLMEEIFLGLRIQEGLKLTRIAEISNRDVKSIVDYLKIQIPSDLGMIKDNRLILADSGWLLSNEIAVKIFDFLV